jgi:hypothetical protein
MSSTPVNTAINIPTASLVTRMDSAQQATHNPCAAKKITLSGQEYLINQRSNGSIGLSKQLKVRIPGGEETPSEVAVDTSASETKNKLGMIHVYENYSNDVARITRKEGPAVDTGSSRLRNFAVALINKPPVEAKDVRAAEAMVERCLNHIHLEKEKYRQNSSDSNLDDLQAAEFWGAAAATNLEQKYSIVHGLNAADAAKLKADREGMAKAAGKLVEPD